MKNSGKSSIFIFGAKTTGPSHIKKNIPCQDSWISEILRDDSAVIAVSDGLGSAKYSQKGAEIAVSAAAESIRQHFFVKYNDGNTSADITRNDCLIREAFFSAVKEIENYSISNNIPKRELACTLIVIFIYKSTVSTGQVGDGAVVGQFKSGDIEILSEPAKSEYINEVTPITADNWLEKLNIHQNILEAVNIAAFTDGCQRAVLIKKDGVYEPFIPFFKPLFNYSQSAGDSKAASDDVRNLLLSQKINEVSDDDKTLVIASFKKDAI